MGKRKATVDLTIRALTPAYMDDLGTVLRTSGAGSGCWCMWPRLNASLQRELPGPGTAEERRRRAMTALSRRRTKPGLIAYRDGKPVGWIAVAPRRELVRIDLSKVTPRVDDVEVWVIPCITVLKKARGQGIAIALIRAAVDHAAKHGAPAVEAYARAGDARVHDEVAYFGTERLFRRAGFRAIRGPLSGLPANAVPRVTMRIECAREP